MLLHPGVLHHLLRGVTLVDVHLQHVLDERLGLIRDHGPLRRVERVLAALHGLTDLLVVVAVEGRVAAQQDV